MNGNGKDLLHSLPFLISLIPTWVEKKKYCAFPMHLTVTYKLKVSGILEKTEITLMNRHCVHTVGLNQKWVGFWVLLFFCSIFKVKLVELK